MTAPIADDFGDINRRLSGTDEPTKVHIPTRQEIFDTVARHLFRQGHRAVTGVGTRQEACLYRAPDGSRCAMGALIPDALYDPQMECKRVQSVAKEWPSVAPHLGYGETANLDDWATGHASFLIALQNVHDEWSDTEEDKLRGLAERLTRFAARYGVKMAVLNELTR